MGAKQALARVFEASGLNSLLAAALDTFAHPYIRAVNYHDIPPSKAADFENQLRYFSDRFVGVGRQELQALLEGDWPHDRPGILLSFDDGLRSHIEVAAPLLEKYGFSGWFAVPACFPDLSIDDIERFKEQHSVNFDDADLGARRPVLDWDDLKRLDDRHVICCHSMTHVRLSASLTDEERASEILEAKLRLEEGLGREVDTFVWVGGEEWAYSRESAQAIGLAGFRYGLMTNNAPIRPGDSQLQLQRTNVEADFPEALLRLKLCGFYDLMDTPKRRRVNRLTET